MTFLPFARPSAFAAGMVAALLALVACSGSEPLDFTDRVPAGAPRIDQHGLRFDPTSLAVKAGEKVYFTNSETALHRVDVDGESVTGDMRRGDVAVYTFTTAGTYALTCPYHPQMKATVTVE